MEPIVKEVGTKCDACCVCLFKVFIIFDLLIPNIGFFIVTIIPYESESKTYFILAFITQGIYLLFMILLPLSFSKSEDCGVCVIFLAFCTVLGIEIACLVYFIKSFSDLKLLAKIGYFAHWSYIPFLIIIICLNKSMETKMSFLFLKKAFDNMIEEEKNNSETI